MNLPSKVLLAALLAASPSGLVGSAAAAPLGMPLSLQDAASPAVEAVQWRGHWGGGRGWGGGHGWWGGPAAGLAAGAIVGGAIAASRPWYGYDYDYDYGPSYNSYGAALGYSDYGYAPGGYVTASPGGDVAYCQQRFRSYDPASGTYLGYDGLRHPCP